MGSPWKIGVLAQNVEEGSLATIAVKAMYVSMSKNTFTVNRVTLINLMYYSI